jgi:hypothetical protein
MWYSKVLQLKTYHATFLRIVCLTYRASLRWRFQSSLYLQTTKRKVIKMQYSIKNFQKTVKVKRNVERKYNDDWKRQRKLARYVKQTMRRKVA